VYIYCDESGSFATAPNRGSWCVVACYVVTESQRAIAEETLRRFKLRAGARHSDEVKRKAATDATYFRFLEDLSRVGGVAIAIATDSGANQGAATNQAVQVRKLADALDGADYEQRREIETLMTDMSGLSPQLYIEYGCRLHLAWRTIRLAALYFAEHHPATLGRFRWQFDDKPPNLKALYRSSIPGFIRELAKEQPLEVLEKADYRHLASFLIPHDVLRGAIDVEVPRPDQRIYDAARMMTEDVSFVDSKACPGVQIADLIVGGLRACLRGEFKDNERAARLLGRLLFDKEMEQQVLPLMFFTADEQSEPSVDETASATMAVMGTTAQRLVMLRRQPQ